MIGSYTISANIRFLRHSMTHGLVGQNELELMQTILHYIMGFRDGMYCTLPDDMETLNLGFIATCLEKTENDEDGPLADLARRIRLDIEETRLIKDGLVKAALR